MSLRRRRHSSTDSDLSDHFVQHIRRRRKIYRPRINYEISDTFTFNEKFRLKRVKAEEIMGQIGSSIANETEKNFSLTPMQQFLTALHWLGNGGQYHGIADMHGVSKSTVCRSVHRVCAAIVDAFFENTVRWPQEYESICERFYNIAGMPFVYGCIDGTLIKIDSPNEFESAYVDRHGNHSINCMLVCGPDYTFYNAYVNWPGSVHDARVLRRSPLYPTFENGFRPFPHRTLLGDTGYPLKDWLMTPVARPSSSVIERYNRAHKSTRRIIENAIGILKIKFPCLNHLRLQPRKAIQIIKCCIILTNISRQDDTNNSFEVPTEEEDSDNLFDNIDNSDGQNALQYYLNYFSRN